MTYSPQAINALYPLLEREFSSAKRSGIAADKPGYHNSRNELRRDGRTNDYSIQLDIDRLGDGDAASAIDCSLNREHMRIATTRLMNASKAGDPRLKGKIREWFGSFDGDGVDGYSLYRNRLATSDSSHEWHIHISGWRKYVNDERVWLGVAEVLLGLQVGALTGPKVYLPTYVVDPLKVSTTLIGNAPAGEKDLECPPGTLITTGEKIVSEDGHDWLVTERDYSFRLDFLVLLSDFEKRPKLEPLTPPEPPRPAPTFRKVAFLNLPGTGNWQGASLAGKDWYAVEARKQKDGSEDCYVYRLPNKEDNDNLKPTEDPMHINADPGYKVHPTGWGVSDTGTLWLTANVKGNNQVVTVDYEPGKVIRSADCREMNVFAGTRNAQIAFDKDNEVCSVRIITAAHDTHILRTKQDILDGVDRPLGTVKIARRPNRVVQGFTVCKNEGGNWELRVLCGLKSAGSSFVIERWSFVKGTGIATVEIPDGLGREPEGIDGDMFAMKCEDREGLDLYRYTV